MWTAHCENFANEAMGKAGEGATEVGEVTVQTERRTETTGRWEEA